MIWEQEHQLREENKRLREAVTELLRANAFGMSVTGGWDDADKDPLYIQCVEADRLGRAALAGHAPKRREQAQAFFASMAPHEGTGGAFAGDERRALAEKVLEACASLRWQDDEDGRPVPVLHPEQADAVRALDLDALLGEGS